MATINDIVLIHLEDTPVSFARVESILPDHKKDWYQIKLLMLQIPLQVVTWILKDAYINGDEFFMNGKKMRLETVECPADESLQAAEPARRESPKSSPPVKQDTGREGKGKIISFSDLKNSSRSNPAPRPEPDPDIG